MYQQILSKVYNFIKLCSMFVRFQADLFIGFVLLKFYLCQNPTVVAGISHYVKCKLLYLTVFIDILLGFDRFMSVYKPIIYFLTNLLIPLVWVSSPFPGTFTKIKNNHELKNSLVNQQLFLYKNNAILKI